MRREENEAGAETRLGPSAKAGNVTDKTPSLFETVRWEVVSAHEVRKADMREYRFLSDATLK